MDSKVICDPMNNIGLRDASASKNIMRVVKSTACVVKLDIFKLFTRGRVNIAVCVSMVGLKQTPIADKEEKEESQMLSIFKLKNGELKFSMFWFGKFSPA